VNRLFATLRGWRERPSTAEALPGFEGRVEALCQYAQQAAGYENELLEAYRDVANQLSQLEAQTENAIDAGADRHALEYVRLIVRLRPQRDLLERELRAFHGVASVLILRVDILMTHMDDARAFARSAELSPAATHFLDSTLTKLTRYFVMLDRVTRARRAELPDRLGAAMLQVIDNRQLDLELATFVLQRRRALDDGTSGDPKRLVG
jgi:hypothetical protein